MQVRLYGINKGIKINIELKLQVTPKNLQYLFHDDYYFVIKLIRLKKNSRRHWFLILINESSHNISGIQISF